MYGCADWKEMYRKTLMIVRFWLDTFLMSFRGQLGRVWYSPWIPIVEVILVVYILTSIQQIAILIGSLMLSAVIFSFVRVSTSRMTTSVWVDLDRYLRCSRPIVLFSNKINVIVDYFRRGYIEDACMGLGIILMIYVSTVLGIFYAIAYPQLLFTYAVIMVLGMLISSYLGF